MWVPNSESELLATINSGTLKETASFDAKENFPSNKELAKDIAAMSTDGGVILIGVGEDKYNNLTIPNPIPLWGVKEKISAIVQSSIQEVPYVKVETIKSSSKPGHGFIVIKAPPSERAPHMLIVGGDCRYYSRTPTGENKRLTEGEVSRLYERRRIALNNATEHFNKIVQNYPLPPKKNQCFLYIAAWPLLSNQNLLSNVSNDRSVHKQLIDEAFQAAVKKEIYPRDRPQFLNDFIIIPTHEYKILTSGYEIQLGQSSDITGQLSIAINNDGTVRLFSGSASAINNDFGQEVFYFKPEYCAGMVIRLIKFIEILLSKLNYNGTICIGLLLKNLKNSMPFHWRNTVLNNPPFPPFNDNEYWRVLQVPMDRIRDDSVSVSRELLMPLVDAMSQGSLDPFKIINQTKG